MFLSTVRLVAKTDKHFQSKCYFITLNWKTFGLFFGFLNCLMRAGRSSWIYAPAAGVCPSPWTRVPHPDVAFHVRRSYQGNRHRARLGCPVRNHARFCQGNISGAIFVLQNQVQLHLIWLKFVYSVLSWWEMDVWTTSILRSWAAS